MFFFKDPDTNTHINIVPEASAWNYTFSSLIILEAQFDMIITYNLIHIIVPLHKLLLCKRRALQFKQMYFFKNDLAAKRPQIEARPYCETLYFMCLPPCIHCPPSCPSIWAQDRRPADLPAYICPTLHQDVLVLIK
jgi:hypothetical protein